MKCAVCKTNEATAGVYCRRCLDNETEWNPISNEELEAAAAMFDRVVAQEQDND